MTSHLLSSIIFTPLIGALAILFVPKSQTGLIKGVAAAATLVVGLLTLAAFSKFYAAEAGFQMIEKHVWIPQFNVHYLLIAFAGIHVLMFFQLKLDFCKMDIRQRVSLGPEPNGTGTLAGS